MTWRLAKGLEQLRKQVNERWPNRSKESDGTRGDAAHSTRKSDHNEDSRGIVHALDITHDPVHGLNAHDLADALLRGQDRRISYIISNRRIGSGPSGISPGKWRRYTGANAHDHHVHFSITAKYEDDTGLWNLDGLATPSIVVNYVPPRPTLREGSRGDEVKFLQGKLGLRTDGIFGFATYKAVVELQNKRKLVADGVVGPATWKIINE